MVQMKTENTILTELRDKGQSPWLDSLSRDMLKNGSLKKWIKQGLGGMTSNPSIFEKAINGSKSYDAQIKPLLKTKKQIFDIYDALTISDIQKACDAFLPLFKKTNGEHGFVSLEVSPVLAYREEETVIEARRLWKLVKRPNLMVKIPSTPEGIKAIRRCIAEGISINITLMFSRKHYQETAQAYIQGLQEFAKKSKDLSRIHSVASVFVSRIDTLVDKKLDELVTSQGKKEALSLKAGAALANCSLIYQDFQSAFNSESFKKLQNQNKANIQKVLWASTSTKNPSYPELMYVEPLIAPHTVNTMPEKTLESFYGKGSVDKKSILEDASAAQETIKKLLSLGVDLEKIGDELQKEGARLFSQSFDDLMASLEKKRAIVSHKPKSAVKVKFQIHKNFSDGFSSRLRNFQDDQFVEKFWKSEPLLWSSEEGHQKVIKNRLGWLKSADWMLGKLHEIDFIEKELSRDGIKDIVLLGMGGSSLAPEVMNAILPKVSSKRKFHILDTTDPGTIAGVQKKINFKTSLFIVASKSGGTIETLSQFNYFWEQVSKKNSQNPGAHFIAITDPGSSLQKLAEAKKFRHIFLNPQDIGGRYSAVSFFGLVPACFVGIDIRKLIQKTRECIALSREKDLKKNIPFYLGFILGDLASQNRDKLTFWSTASLQPFEPWLEQLIAESTGKEGKGIVPVIQEKPGNPDVYGADRVFVLFKLQGEKALELENRKKELLKKGFPVIEVEWTDRWSLGYDFLAWELAVASASAWLKINPFDEPNVKESKDNTAKILEGLKSTKSFPSTQSSKSFKLLCQEAVPGKYLALLVYGERSAANQEAFAKFQARLRDRLKIPVLVGFGPRYLHSIGQLYKGGAPAGIFAIFISKDQKDFKVPEAFYTFGELKKSQALGDFQAFDSRKWPVSWNELSNNVSFKNDGLM